MLQLKQLAPGLVARLAVEGNLHVGILLLHRLQHLLGFGANPGALGRLEAGVLALGAQELAKRQGGTGLGLLAAAFVGDGAEQLFPGWNPVRGHGQASLADALVLEVMFAEQIDGVACVFLRPE